MTWKELRTWCEENEPIFRLIEALAVPVIGGVIAYQQNKLTESANQISASELQQVELQTQIAASQAKLAERAYAADFRFGHSIDQFTASVFVKDSKENARYIEAKAKYYIEQDMGNNEKKRILIDGFFRQYHSQPKEYGQELHLHYPVSLHGIANVALLIPDLEGESYRKLLELRKTKSVKPCVYLELTYYDASNKFQTERFCMDFPGEAAYPVQAEPEYWQTISFAKFFDASRERDPDGKKLVKELTEEVNRLINTLPNFGKSIVGLL